ncbi:hypothetical protein O181_022872 [Austropuccinia psidii MF-1]|uniref:Reverse transcriptase domain-containing protein n=1 Tax=Austropuccinia psidii MF-1 TaxID=1389203 RepID=A0A9Q3CGD9_9BASI|nr:hypothetical protein [Austropuccinia psidii MF-1]
MVIYGYTRIPFGIKNAPSNFQRMMDTIFQVEILGGWMVVYIDDIIMSSETWEDHSKYIDSLLSKCTPINLKISLKKRHFGQQKLLALGHKVLGVSLAIDQNKVSAVLQKEVPKNIKGMEYLLGFASYYRNHIKNFAHITTSLYKLYSKDLGFEITKERRDAYKKIKHELTNALLLILPDFELSFKLYIDAAFSQGLGEALHQRKIVDGEPREGVICYISRKLKDPEARYGATQTECLFLAWVLEILHYYMEGAVFEKIAAQEYRGNIKIIYKEGKSHTNAEGLRRWPLDNDKRKPAYNPELAAKIPIHLMEIERRKDFRFSEWAPESGTPDSEDTE